MSETAEKTDLVVASEKSLQKAFTDDNVLQQILDDLERRVSEFKETETIELDKEADRKKVRSFAYLLRRAKTTMDNTGKSLKEEAQKIVTATDEARRKVRTSIDEMIDNVLADVVKWENAEEERVNLHLEAMEQLLPFFKTGDRPTTAEITEEIDRIDRALKVREWEEFKTPASEKVDESKHALEQLRELAEEREELERLRAEEERRQKEEQERLAAEEAKRREAEEKKRKAEEDERRKRQAEEDRLRAEKVAEEEAARKAKWEAEEAERKAKVAAEEKERQERIKREEEALAEQRRAAEKEAKKLAEERAAKEREEREARLHAEIHRVSMHPDLQPDALLAMISDAGDQLTADDQLAIAIHQTIERVEVETWNNSREGS